MRVLTTENSNIINKMIDSMERLIFEIIYLYNI